MSKNDELVLVCKAEDLRLLGDPKGFAQRDGGTLQQFFKKASLTYLARRVAETDESHKQIIPYCLIRNINDKSKYFVYQRSKKAGEDRLHDLYSLGVGGHINPVLKDCPDQDIFWENVDRELHEETTIEQYISHTRGVLYDDSNPVGRVHLGIVIDVFPFKSDIKSKDEAVINTSFMTLQEASEKNLEGWSRIIVDKLLPLQG